MPAYGDIRQQIILALESQGADALTILLQALEDLRTKQTALTGEFQAGGKTADEYIKQLARLDAEIKKLQGSFKDAGNEFSTMSELQKALGAMEQKTARDSVEAAQATAGARRAGTQAVVDHIAKVREEAAAIEAARVAEIKAMGDRAQAYARFERQVDEAIAATKREAMEAAAAMNHVATASASASTGIGAANTNLQGTGKAGQAAARGVLELSRGVEDLATGGFLGILNNIPGTISNFGTAAGASATAVGVLTAGVSIFATVAYLAYQNWDKITELFAAGLPPKLIDDMKGAEAELKALTDKKWKTGVDFQDIRILNEELRKANEQQATLNRLKSGKTEEQEKRSKVVSEAITQGGGVDSVISAVEQLTPIAPSEQTNKLKAKIAEYDRRINVSSKDVEARGGTVKQVLEAQYDEFMRDALIKLRGAVQKDLTDVESTDRENRLKGASALVTKAGGGDEAARAKLQQLFEANQEAFTNRGIDPLRFGAGLANAAPANLFADERRKIAEKRAKDEEEIQKRLGKAELDAKVVAEKAADDRKKKDEEVEATVAEVEQWTGHQALKGEADKAKAAGAGAKRDDAAELQMMRSIAQSNQRRSKDQQPGSSVSAQLQTQALMEQTLGIVGPATQQIQQIMRNNQLLGMKVQAITQAVNRGRTIRPTNSPNIQR